MTAISVVGSNPVSVLTGDGKQLGVPLTLLAVKDGAIDTSRLDPAIVGDATPVLRSLYNSKSLVAGEAGAPELALTLKAKTPGAAGNSITVTFANVAADESAPENSTADVTITYEDRREGLTPASAGTQLGKPGGATKAGLVRLTAAATKLPALLPATALTEANPGDPLTLVVPAEDGSGDAFTLEAVGSDPLLEFVTVAIEDVDTTAGTFTLVIALDHTETGAQLDELDGKFGLLLDVEAGADGFAAPADGTVTLGGGGDAETSAATAAEASVFSN